MLHSVIAWSNFKGPAALLETTHISLPQLLNGLQKTMDYLDDHCFGWYCYFQHALLANVNLVCWSGLNAVESIKSGQRFIADNLFETITLMWSAVHHLMSTCCYGFVLLILQSNIQLGLVW